MIFEHISRDRDLLHWVDYYLSEGNQWDNLAHWQQERLAGLAIRAVGDDGSLCILESNDIAMITFILSERLQGRETSSDIETALCKSAVRYFSADLRELFEIRQHKMTYDSNIEHGMIPQTHRETGEIVWSKRA